jgi:SAM-dependent methyltransferase
MVWHMPYDAQRLRQEYDEAYKKPDHFGHQAVLERPFLKAVVEKAQLPAGASVLDAGCGQGFFSCLFADLGFKPLGVDLSPEGISSARRQYGESGARFETGDLFSLPYLDTFDCVFARGLSLYNSEEFENRNEITNVLLRYVKRGGVYIFVHYTALNRRQKSTSWVYHSMKNVRRHFAVYPNTTVHFSLRSETRLLGSLAFSSMVSAINAFISRTTGMGGCAVALVRKG